MAFHFGCCKRNTGRGKHQGRALPAIDSTEVEVTIERYSIEEDHSEEEFVNLYVALNASNRQWSEMFLQDRLGEDGIEKYRQWQKQQAEQKKQQVRDGKKQTELKDDI